jgi:thiol-disulfide isomerase/thioredoxin
VFPFRVPVEGQTVRRVVGVALAVICLGLAGCSLFGKKQAAHTNNTNPKPFLGKETPAKTEMTALPRGGDEPLPNANGMLAGRVIVEATGRPIKADILIKPFEREEDKGAELHVWTDESGYFTIPKLKVGEGYVLLVRAEENGELISKKIWAKPPQLTLFIPLDKKYTTQATPKPPDLPKVPEGKKETPATGSSREGSPSAILEAPTQSGEENTSPTTGPGRDTPADTTNIAEGEFRRINPAAPQPASIPSPPPISIEPKWESVPEPSPPAKPRPPGSVELPNVPTTVPSCGLYGNHLENFALYDLDGKVWEYKRDRRGRLTLLDFWYSTCGPCLNAIHHLKDLQSDYGRYGLQVIGIACETGTLEQQRSKASQVRIRYQMNYMTLLSGGGPDRCPVVSSFQVTAFPTLVLIDGNGTIIWHSPRGGMDDYALNNLRKKINDLLVVRQSMP